MYNSKLRLKNYSNNTTQKHGFRNKKSKFPTQSKSVTSPNTKCFGCGGNHWRQYYPYKDVTCNICNAKGHISTACHKKAKQRTDYINNTHTNQI